MFVIIIVESLLSLVIQWICREDRHFATWRRPNEIRFVLHAEELIKDIDGIDVRRVSAQQVVFIYHVPGGGGRPQPSAPV